MTETISGKHKAFMIYTFILLVFIIVILIVMPKLFRYISNLDMFGYEDKRVLYQYT